MITIASWEIYKKPGETKAGTIARLCRELAKEKKKAGKQPASIIFFKKIPGENYSKKRKK